MWGTATARPLASVETESLDQYLTGVVEALHANEMSAVDPQLMAIEEKGRWGIVRLSGLEQVQLLQEAYPFLESIVPPATTSTVLID